MTQFCFWDCLIFETYPSKQPEQGFRAVHTLFCGKKTLVSDVSLSLKTIHPEGTTATVFHSTALSPITQSDPWRSQERMTKNLSSLFPSLIRSSVEADNTIWVCCSRSYRDWADQRIILPQNRVLKKNMETICPGQHLKTEISNNGSKSSDSECSWAFCEKESWRSSSEDWCLTTVYSQRDLSPNLCFTMFSRPEHPLRNWMCSRPLWWKYNFFGCLPPVWKNGDFFLTIMSEF